MFRLAVQNSGRTVSQWAASRSISTTTTSRSSSNRRGGPLGAALFGAAGLTAASASAAAVAGSSSSSAWHIDAAVACHAKTPKALAALRFPSDPNDLQGWWALRGEDAFFLSESTSAFVFGVADGVGGWRSKGVDPSVISGELMKQSERLVVEDDLWVPSQILSRGFAATVASGRVVAGSTTACIASLSKKDGMLQCSNLGDSGLVVLDPTGQQIQFATEPQEHYKNCPYQLAIVPEADRNSSRQDTPESAHNTVTVTQDKCLIIMGTDGFFDNMYPSDVAEVIKETGASAPVSVLALALMKQSFAYSINTKRRSPFAAEYRGETGGKPDDITVVVARVHQPAKTSNNNPKISSKL